MVYLDDQSVYDKTANRLEIEQGNKEELIIDPVENVYTRNRAVVITKLEINCNFNNLQKINSLTLKRIIL